MKVNSEKEAWDLAARLFPEEFEYDPTESKRAGYPIYSSTKNGSLAHISDLGNRLELNYDTGKSENIWIVPADEPAHSQNVVTIGVRLEREVFGAVKVLDIKDVLYHHAVGMVCTTLENGKPALELTLENGETATFGCESIAYIRFGN